MKKNTLLLLGVLLLFTLLLSGCDDESMKALDEKVAGLQSMIKEGPQDIQDWVDDALDVNSKVTPENPAEASEQPDASAQPDASGQPQVTQEAE